MMQPMNWDDVQVFLAIARHGTLGAAGRALQQSQPTMGRRLKALEHSLGHTLFQRTSEGFVLTDEGAAVLRHAEGMEAQALSFSRQLDGADQQLEGALRVSTSDWFGLHVLAPLCAGRVPGGARAMSRIHRSLRASAAMRQYVDHRQNKGCGLPGPGLGNADHVAHHQDRRDDPRLNRRRFAIARLVDGAQKFVGKADVGKFHRVIMSGKKGSAPRPTPARAAAANGESAMKSQEKATKPS